MRVLAIGAHPDDVEIGCGGALAGHVAVGDDVTMLVMTDGAAGPRGATSRENEQALAADILGARLRWGKMIDCGMEFDRSTISVIEQAIDAVQPDLIYTHGPHDSHQDHVVVSRATVAAARNTPSIMFYESPSTLEFAPNVFVDIGDHLATKLAALGAHQSQVSGSSRVNLSAVDAGARYWGFKARTVCAEPFYAVRLMLNSQSRSHVSLV